MLLSTIMAALLKTINGYKPASVEAMLLSIIKDAVVQRLKQRRHNKKMNMLARELYGAILTKRVYERIVDDSIIRSNVANSKFIRSIVYFHIENEIAHMKELSG